MAYEVVLSDAFTADYDQAIEYLSETLNSPTAASNLMLEADRARILLMDFPFMNAASAKLNSRQVGIRVHVLSRYLVPYSAQEEVVRFVRLFHQSRLYESGEHWLDSV